VGVGVGLEVGCLAHLPMPVPVPVPSAFFPLHLQNKFALSIMVHDVS
jgi:hypothetical protein